MTKERKPNPIYIHCEPTKTNIKQTRTKEGQQ